MKHLNFDFAGFPEPRVRRFGTANGKLIPGYLFGGRGPQLMAIFQITHLRRIDGTLRKTRN
jgi:hypothetical protein